MTVAERISRCRLLEDMKRQPEFSRRIGLSDGSYFRRPDEKKSVNSHRNGGSSEPGKVVE